MKEKLKHLWKGLTLNEKLMYGLLVAFVIGIFVRWDFITSEVNESVTNLFTPSERDSLMMDSLAKDAALKDSLKLK